MGKRDADEQDARPRFVGLSPRPYSGRGQGEGSFLRTKEGASTRRPLSPSTGRGECPRSLLDVLHRILTEPILELLQIQTPRLDVLPEGFPIPVLARPKRALRLGPNETDRPVLRRR